MKKLKKAGILWVMALWLVFGGSVQAAEEQAKSPEAILEKANAAMETKKIIQIDQYITVQGQEQRLFSMISDSETGSSYIDMLGIRVYQDAVKGLMYYYDSSNRKWYVAVTGSADEEEKLPSVDLPDTEVVTNPDKIRNPQTELTYIGQKVYRGVLCEVIDVVTRDKDQESRGTYYIDAETYLLYGVAASEDDIISEMVWHYPDSFEIPKTVVKQAVLATGTEFKQGSLEYVAVKSGSKQAVKVKKGKKAAGNVVIPDKVTFANKSYAVIGIEDKAFTGNRKIKKVTMGKNIKSIGKEAFRKCTKLGQVTIRSVKLSRVGNKAFYGTAKKLKIKAPKAKMKAYKKMLEQSKVSSKLKVVKL